MGDEPSEPVSPGLRDDVQASLPRRTLLPPAVPVKPSPPPRGSLRRAGARTSCQSRGHHSRASPGLPHGRARNKCVCGQRQRSEMPVTVGKSWERPDNARTDAQALRVLPAQGLPAAPGCSWRPRRPGGVPQPRSCGFTPGSRPRWSESSELGPGLSPPCGLGEGAEAPGSKRTPRFWRPRGDLRTGACPRGEPRALHPPRKLSRKVAAGRAG